ncbi:tail assembly chaperone E/41/14-like protein [Crenobacter luteus]|uniref:phage tail assembly protein n=1 Tax=Crenobacter luteus TaxID=1452487 RepID=UPI001042F7C6|nr:phage tail assembly protein [Crenobacter luteus]TCP13780.1 tail assembly chaperone E/41/14-like protein [Crenobacter luteus]
MTTTKTITLDTPIKRGDDSIITIDLRKPAAGELRGCNLTDLLQMDVAALQRVVPRISTPALTEQEVARMDPADLLQMGSEVAGFLLPKATKPEAFQPE